MERIMKYPPALTPTFYFIGVTTAKSSIMRVFPAWAKHLGLGDVEIKGIDLKIHDDPENYREAVRFIKADPLSLGALVTTHKLDLLKACRDLFEELDPYAQLTGEISCISKRNGQLVGHAKDPITAGCSLEAFLPANHWEKTGAEAMVLGAGGSSVALTCYMLEEKHGANKPSRIIVTNRSEPRLHEMREIHRKVGANLPIEYLLVNTPEKTDEIMATLKPGSLVVNATGLGKDAPGSPITDRGLFPLDGFAWEFNYRGELVFLDQANAQAASRNLHVEDGWIYFIHGWTRVIAEVFHIDIPSHGPAFDQIAQIAREVR
jgi:shikimate 5-dehydrogenase